MAEIISVKLESFTNDICSSPQSWTGHLLMLDDLWFEGIVKFNGLNNKELIIGCLINNKINIMKYSNLTFSALNFIAISDGKKLHGDLNLNTPGNNNYFLGKCEILISNAKMNDIDIEKLKYDISCFKTYTNDFNKNMIKDITINKRDMILNLLEFEQNDPSIRLQLKN